MFQELYSFLDRQPDAAVSDITERESRYGKAYEAFCNTVIKEKIIKNKEIFLMTSLLKLFMSLVKKVEGLDVITYRTAQLKSRLKHDFLQLLFLSSRRQNASEIVLIETSSLVDRMSSSSETFTESESDVSDSECKNSPEITERPTTSSTGCDLEKTGILFKAVSLLKMPFSSVLL